MGVEVGQDEEIQGIVLEELAKSDDWGTVRAAVIKRLTAEKRKGLGRYCKQAVNQAIVDLIIGRYVTVGSGDGVYDSHGWPSIVLTNIGKSLAAEGLRLQGADGYITYLRNCAPSVEDITVEYVMEAYGCFRQDLLFACSVMLGAAAEREVFRLARAILEWQGESEGKLKDALDRGRLPGLLEGIGKAIETARRGESMPYSAHQGSSQHLQSLLEMVRVQRNEAVHSGVVSKEQVFMTIQCFPVVMGALDRLRSWFDEQKRG